MMEDTVANTSKPELRRHRPSGRVLHVQVLARKRNPLVDLRTIAHLPPDQSNVDTIADHRPRTVEVANGGRVLNRNQHARRRCQWLKQSRLFNVHLVLGVHQKPVQSPFRCRFQSGFLVLCALQ
jgi:hypothetical protein